MYTLDTNAIIYYLRDESQVVEIFRDILMQSVPIYISTITEVELFSFSQLLVSEEERINAILNTLAILPVDSNIARKAGRIKNQQGLKIVDSIIAATALLTRTTLLTRNIRDFRKVPGLEVRKI